MNLFSSFLISLKQLSFLVVSNFFGIESKDILLSIENNFLSRFLEKFLNFHKVVIEFISFSLVIFIAFIVLLLLKKIIKFSTYTFLSKIFLKLEKTGLNFEELFRRYISAAAFFTIFLFYPIFFPLTGTFFSIFYKGVESYIIWKFVRLISFSAVNLCYIPSLKSVHESVPLEGLLQFISFLIYTIGFVSIILIFFGLSLSGFLTGIGALSAVLLLVFQDTILNITSIFKLYSDKMIKEGDWIEVASVDCEGIVTDVSFNLIKVQNWDMTVTSFTPRYLISSSFKNWSKMVDAGARRSRQYVWIDLDSIQIFETKDVSSLSDMKLFSKFFENKGPDYLANLEYINNVKLFRDYFRFFLLTHSKVSPNLSVFVRPKDVTDKGFPIEIIFYSFLTDTLEFNTLQAEVIEHVYSVLRYFKLKSYQTIRGFISEIDDKSLLPSSPE